MVKAGLVYGAATEDMDCLTFGSTVMLRHLTASEAKSVHTHSPLTLYSNSIQENTSEGDQLGEAVIRAGYHSTRGRIIIIYTPLS